MKNFAKYALRSTAESSENGLGFGCMGITAFYGAAMNDSEVMELLKTVYDKGCRHFDTAEVYAANGKHNEDVLGKFLKTVSRDSFSVAAKFWPGTGNGFEIIQDASIFTYDNVKTHLTKSLERLQLEYVDLYYAHRVPTLEDGLEYARIMKRLKEEGLVREVGVSEVGADWLRQIHDICPIDAVQQEWSLLTRNLEASLVPTCAELGITIVAYSPLARNMLVTAQHTFEEGDARIILPRYAKENMEKNKKIAEAVADLAKKYGCTAAQLSLRWLFHKADTMGVAVIPIPGSTKVHHAMDNLGAVKINITNEDDMKVLESFTESVAGARAPEQLMEYYIERHDN